MAATALGWQAGLSLATALGSLLLLAANRIAADVVMMGAMGLLLICGVLTPKEALNGFANEGLMTIAALYVVATALQRSGAVATLARLLLGQPRHPASMVLRVMLPTSLLSAFVNNTPVVAMLIPAVQEWARRLQQPASRFLLPLSYASILGGTCTLIGTSTNLVVNGLLIDYRGKGLGMFDIACVGLPLLLGSTLFVALASRHLLPRRQSPMEQLESAREYCVQMRVLDNGPLCGLSIQQAGLRQLGYGYLVDIERAGQLLCAVPPRAAPAGRRSSAVHRQQRCRRRAARHPRPGSGRRPTGQAGHRPAPATTGGGRHRARRLAGGPQCARQPLPHPFQCRDPVAVAQRQSTHRQDRRP